MDRAETFSYLLLRPEAVSVHTTAFWCSIHCAIMQLNAKCSRAQEELVGQVLTEGRIVDATNHAAQ
jgi:hypothetical protein